jgi:streptogramin lyase
MNRYLFFYTLDHTNTQTTTGYSLPITPFTFVPVLDVGTDQVVSNTKLMWDFGDGTTSRDITASHVYSIPGTYNVTCYLYGTGGQGFESSFTQSVFVKDYITDALSISASNINIIEVGHYQSPFVLLRQNSWQTYPTLSSAGSTIQLFASGTGAPYYDAVQYNTDKHAHLKPFSRFLAYEYNSALSAEELVPVDRVNTRFNTDIYVKLDDYNNIVTCDANDTGSTLAGTSGTRVVYFVDDKIKPPLSGSLLPAPVVTLAYFDSTQLYDNDSYGSTVPTSEYPVLHQIVSNWYIPTFIDQITIDHLSITSNGIDGEGSVNNSFNISTDKFAGQKIPFIVKVKDTQHYSSKSSSLLTLLPQTHALTANTVKVYLLSSNGSNITDGVVFRDNFGEFQGQSTGGFFKGYLSAGKSYENVQLYAVAQLSGADYYVLPTPYSVVAQPQSRLLHKIDIQQSSGDSAFATYTENLYSTALTGIYAASVYPSRTTSSGAVDYFIWVVDSDRDLLSKYDVNGGLVFDCHLPVGSSPSHIAADKDGNIWVSLYDSVSTLKIESITGNILASAVPLLSNIDWTDPSYYLPLSGHAGSNSITPAAIDTDKENNLWVAYNHPLSSFICKYATNGQVLSTIRVDDGYSPCEIVATIHSGVFVIYKHDEHALNSIESSDVLAHISTSGGVSSIPMSATLWNMTVDVADNIWITANKHDVIQYDTAVHTTTLYALPSSTDVTPSSDLAGIACTTSNSIMVVSRANKCVYAFSISNVVSGDITSLSSVALTNAYDLSGNNIFQNNINAVGDWTGFKYINKFYRHFGFVDGIQGYSSFFNIYPETGKYSIGKKNENFDADAQYKAYIFQEPFNDYFKLFDDFIGTAVGNATSEPNTLGKKIYEKIANFTDNIVDVDICNVDALKSLHQMLNENFYNLHSNALNYYPANLSRLVDLLSIKYTKLRGDRNMFSENFDDKGFYGSIDPVNSTVKYGMNKSAQIDISTKILTAGVDGQLVAYEKFSGEFHTVNTNLLTATYIDPTRHTYALSSYDASWGWGLVLPDDYVTTDLSKYYAFFDYVSGHDMTQMSGVINWSDNNTTVSEHISSTQVWTSIMENMLTYTLAEGLKVVPSI